MRACVIDEKLNSIGLNLDDKDIPLKIELVADGFLLKQTLGNKQITIHLDGLEVFQLAKFYSEKRGKTE